MTTLPNHHRRALEHLSPKGIRIPPGTPPAHAVLADASMARMIDVMMEDVHPSVAPSVLKAACVIREEICGPIVKKLEIRASLEQLLTESMEDSP
jgi:hypothetical protein